MSAFDPARELYPWMNPQPLTTDAPGQLTSTSTTLNIHSGKPAKAGMQGCIKLDAATSAKIDELVADWIMKNVLRKTVMVTKIAKVPDDYGHTLAGRYLVDFQDLLDEMAGDQ
jgi:hypothetical protein